MNTNPRKLALPLICMGTLLFLAGCASHNDPATVQAAPGVTPPAVIAPPPPMTYRPGFMEQRRKAALPPPASH